MRNLVFLFVMICAVSVQAQTCVPGTVSGTVSKPCYTLDYDQFVSDKTQAQYSIPSFPNWEVWVTSYGVTYVVLQREQTMLDKLSVYGRSNFVGLNLGFLQKDESVVNR